MKFKLLLSISFVLSILSFLSCDDDSRTVGTSIRPNTDAIDVKADTVSLQAKTVPMDSIYLRTIYGLVGDYHEPLFGSTKADYLCELYCDSASFKAGNDRNTIRIDSVRFNITFFNFVGDSISPMDISVYKVNKPLKRINYTNINPSEYYSSQDIVGQQSFSIHNLAKSSTGGRTISTPLNKELGEFFLKTWKEEPNVLAKPDNLKKRFPGFYITSRFGKGTLINVDYSIFDIHYSYLGKTKDAKRDSTYHAIFSLSVTPEVIQMNHVENKNPELLNKDNADRTYIKSPAGVCTQISIPLKEILNKKNNLIINSAKFSLTGNTPLESVSKLPRPSRLLFINKDSLNTFFIERKLPDSKSSYILTNSNLLNINTSKGKESNKYTFSSSDPSSIGNIAPLINHYAELKAKGTAVPDVLNYMLIPIDIETNDLGYVSNIYNSMTPASAILRTDPKYMKLSLIFSKYNNN